MPCVMAQIHIKEKGSGRLFHRYVCLPNTATKRHRRLRPLTHPPSTRGITLAKSHRFAVVTIQQPLIRFTGGIRVVIADPAVCRRGKVSISPSHKQESGKVLEKVGRNLLGRVHNAGIVGHAPQQRSVVLQRSFQALATNAPTTGTRTGKLHSNDREWITQGQHPQRSGEVAAHFIDLSLRVQLQQPGAQFKGNAQPVARTVHSVHVREHGCRL
eukprot:COSAG06_NODE_249_length_19140_cov_18.998004_18_plen_214_part_00